MNYKNKWIILIFLCIIMLFYINYYNSEYETLEGDIKNSPDNSQTLRKLSDFYNERAGDTYKKIIHLKCKIDTEEFYLANINKKNINSNCNLCSLGDLKDRMSILVNKKNVIHKDCKNLETTKCYNTDNINDCESYVDKICDQKKIKSSDCEIILEQRKIKDPKEEYYLLKSNENPKSSIFLSLIEEPKKAPEVIDPTKIKISDFIKSYFVCFNNIPGGILNEKEKIYIDNTDIPKDKIRFRIYFKIDQKEKFLGVSKTSLCEDLICKEEKCQNNFKYLTLYDNKTDPNVLIFEPELVEIIG
jgi:hypothetical protein